MRLERKLAAPLLAIFLVVVAGLALTHLQTRSESSPSTFDPQFDLWANDPARGRSRPMAWEVEYVQGTGDEILLQQTVKQGRRALGISVFQDGSDEKWVYVKLTGTIEGVRLKSLLSDEVGVWIYLEPICLPCRVASASQLGIFGVQITDGMHTIDFLFSDQTAETEQILSHRTVFLTTPRGEWVHHRIGVGEEYESAGWKAPDRLSLSMVLGAMGSAVGWHLAYVHAFTVTTNPATHTVQQEQDERVPGAVGLCERLRTCTIDSLRD